MIDLIDPRTTKDYWNNFNEIRRDDGILNALRYDFDKTLSRAYDGFRSTEIKLFEDYILFLAVPIIAYQLIRSRLTSKNFFSKP